jgi:cyclophilin family peptidyl-prolyl cis-trans isomerase
MALDRLGETMFKLFQSFTFIALLTLSNLCFSQATAPKVSLQTNVGEIIIELNAEAAPGVIFHRVIKDFMIQAGGLRFDMTRKPPNRPPIVNESSNGLKNLKYTIAMARTNAPNSATSQFFINHKNNAFLDGQEGRAGYAVFGKVVKGMDVVDKIALTQTKNLGRHANVPIQTISIIKALVIKPTLTKPAEQKSPNTALPNKPKI